MNRTRKIILTPSTKPRRLLKQHADYRRDAHNWTLRDYKDKCAAEEPHPTSMLLPVWEGERASAYPQSAQLCRSAGQHAVYALENAIKASEDKTRHNKAPRFHGQDHKIAFRADKRAVKVRCDKKRIELPNIGKVRMLESLNPEDPISTVTVTYEDERWWACVEVEMKNPPASLGTEIIGVDVGLGTIAVCSDGTRYEIPEALKSLRREIGRLTRRLARQVEGSGHHERVQRQLQKARYLARCWREEAQHKAANEIVAKARMVVVESLDVRDMMNRGGRRLAGGIARAAMSALQYKIQYRCEAAGVEFVKAPADFPSTRKCSRCGEPQDMPLSKRVYECLCCGLVIDRDGNAALNLQHYGETLSL